MPELVIIADTSCLIVLSTIGELDLLEKVFGTVTITEQVSQEYKEKLPDWIKIRKAPERLLKALTATVDVGEASSISLALEVKDDCLLLMDDLRARKFAKNLGLKVIGTLGIIAKAQKEGNIESGMIMRGQTVGYSPPWRGWKMFHTNKMLLGWV
jgi:predicted nucleic acid-binding protein